MPLEGCSTVIFPLERLNFSPGCPQKRNHQKGGLIQHLGLPILLSSPRQLLMLVFQCENPCALSGMTMTECVTLLFFHKVIIFLILNFSRLSSRPSQITANLLPTCLRLAQMKNIRRTFSNTMLTFTFCQQRYKWFNIYCPAFQKLLSLKT